MTAFNRLKKSAAKKKKKNLLHYRIYFLKSFQLEKKRENSKALPCDKK
jgi:hypothetical protein